MLRRKRIAQTKKNFDKNLDSEKNQLKMNKSRKKQPHLKIIMI